MTEKKGILLESGTNELEVIEFILKHPSARGELVSQSFGINVAKVREIIKMPELTDLPSSDQSLHGIFNLRGTLTPVLDLNRKLFDYHSDAEKKKLIVSEFNNTRIGFVVDDVRRIHRLSWVQVESPQSVTRMDVKTNLIVGIIKDRDPMILMLDIERLIADINPTLGINPPTPPVNPAPARNKVMFVEDSPIIRGMLVERLTQAGFAVKDYPNGKEAWRALVEISSICRNPQEVAQHVDIVISDIEMPMMDGYTLTRRIKNHKLFNNLPVIIFSSMTSSDGLHKGESVGVDAQLAKPDVGAILDKIHELVGDEKPLPY